MSGQEKRLSEWLRLFRIACSLIDQVNKDQTVIDHWTFGGGTAMMLQIGHRESHDVDIFFRKSEFLQYLNPETVDFDLEIMPASYDGDGSRFRKFAFNDIGEIDFIVASSLTARPTLLKEIDGKNVLLETVPEIIVKKIYHRGANIKPRDIFDIAAAARVCEEQIVDALRAYPEETKGAVAEMDKRNPDFITAAISGLMIKDDFRDLVETSLSEARRVLNLV